MQTKLGRCTKDNHDQQVMVEEPVDQQRPASWLEQGLEQEQQQNPGQECQRLGKGSNSR